MRARRIGKQVRIKVQDGSDADIFLLANRIWTMRTIEGSVAIYWIYTK